MTISLSAADAGLFARQLMHHAYLELERYDNMDDPCFYHYDDVDPVQILQTSYEASLLDAEKEASDRVEHRTHTLTHTLTDTLIFQPFFFFGL